MLHQLHAEQRLRSVGELPNPDLDLFHRCEHRELELPQQELLFDSLSQARMKCHAKAFGRRQTGDPVLECVEAEARHDVSVGRALARIPNDKPVRHQPRPRFRQSERDFGIVCGSVLLGLAHPVLPVPAIDAVVVVEN